MVMASQMLGMAFLRAHMYPQCYSVFGGERRGAPVAAFCAWTMRERADTNTWEKKRFDQSRRRQTGIGRRSSGGPGGTRAGNKAPY